MAPPSESDTAQSANITSESKRDAIPSRVAADGQERHVYKWIDADGVGHYGDSVPPEFAECPKEGLSDDCNRTEGQLAQELLQRKAEIARMLSHERANQALLNNCMKNLNSDPPQGHRRPQRCLAKICAMELRLQTLYRKLDLLEATSKESEVSDSLLQEIHFTKHKIGKLKDRVKLYKEDVEHCQEELERFQDSPLRLQDAGAEELASFLV